MTIVIGRSSEATDLGSERIWPACLRDKHSGQQQA
jgi:hypothetical protein